MYLLDTNVFSEMGKGRPNPEVLRWLIATPEHQTHMSVVTIGEIQTGAENIRRSNPNRATELEEWLEGLVSKRPVLDLTADVMRQWGKIKLRQQEIKFLDLMIVATAMVHGLTIATRNIRDFEGFGVELINPFES